MEIRVDVDATKAIEGLHELQMESMPYALARSLTATAKDAQAAVQGGLTGKFKLRNQFFKQGIRIKPADKRSDTRIEADVHTYTENKVSGAPGFTERQEQGGEKVPIGGHSHIAIPTKYLRKYASGVIPTPLRPRSLLPASAEEGGVYSGTLGRVVGGPTGRRLTQRATRALRQGYAAFVKRAGPGTLCIFVRLEGSRDIEPWYVLIEEANVKARLGMHETVQKVAVEQFPRNWESAWRDILDKGLRVRF